MIISIKKRVLKNVEKIAKNVEKLKKTVDIIKGVCYYLIVACERTLNTGV